MGESLRDQLVKAGLASSAEAKKAERQQRKQQLDKKRGKTPVDQPDVKAKVQRAKKDKATKDRALARERNDKYAARALRAEIKQMILQHDQRAKKTNDDDVPYNFVHGKRIKRIYLPEAQKAQLISGSLVVVNNDGLYHFVSKDIAERIAKRDPKRIIVANDQKTSEPTEDDEYYAKFAVPDDLDW
ncbi:MAG: DUF2058 domain-containing protein [Pseudomonadales bacterium]|nr:DUF2058 domain-containing protein [Pseudomonadales bacterium]